MSRSAVLWATVWIILTGLLAWLWPTLAGSGYTVLLAPLTGWLLFTGLLGFLILSERRP